MKTNRNAWTVYRIRVWAGLGLALLLGLGELWMALRFQSNSTFGDGTAVPVRQFEVCDILR